MCSYILPRTYFLFFALRMGEDRRTKPVSLRLFRLSFQHKRHLEKCMVLVVGEVYGYLLYSHEEDKNHEHG